MFETESEYNIAIGKLVAGPEHLSIDERFALAQTIGQLESLLDACDEVDRFGSGGWRHTFGWE